MNLVECPIDGCRKALPTVAAICGHMAHHSVGPDESKRLMTDGGGASDLPNFEESDLEGPPDEDEKVDPPTDETKDVHNGIERMTEDESKSMSLRDEANKILPGSDPLESITAEYLGNAQYRVVSYRNGSITTHEVDIREPSCSCEDWEYNLNNGEREVCSHWIVAFDQFGGIEMEEMALEDMAKLMATATESYKAVEESRSVLRDIENSARMIQSDASQQSMDASEAMAEPTNTGPDVDEVAEELQEAYDGFVADMQVRTSDNFIWPQTGPDTPDEVETPGPGPSINVFEDLLQKAEQVEFVPEDADPGRMSDGYRNAPKERPNQYSKNALTPRDCREYIDEVLS